MTSIKDALDDVLSRIAVFRDYQPEEDETWESWYFAAFDLLWAEVSTMRKKALTTPAPGRDELRERIARFLCDYDLYHGAWDGEKLCNEGTGRVWPNDKAKPYWLQADEFMKRFDAILSALPVAPVIDEAAIRADVELLDALIAADGLLQELGHSLPQVKAAIRAGGGER